MFILREVVWTLAVYVGLRVVFCHLFASEQLDDALVLAGNFNLTNNPGVLKCS